MVVLKVLWRIVKYSLYLPGHKRVGHCAAQQLKKTGAKNGVIVLS